MTYVKITKEELQELLYAAEGWANELRDFIAPGSAGYNDDESAKSQYESAEKLDAICRKYQSIAF